MQLSEAKNLAVTVRTAYAQHHREAEELVKTLKSSKELKKLRFEVDPGIFGRVRDFGYDHMGEVFAVIEIEGSTKLSPRFIGLEFLTEAAEQDA